MEEKFLGPLKKGSQAVSNFYILEEEKCVYVRLRRNEEEYKKISEQLSQCEKENVRVHENVFIGQHLIMEEGGICKRVQVQGHHGDQIEVFVLDSGKTKWASKCTLFKTKKVWGDISTFPLAIRISLGDSVGYYLRYNKTFII